MERHEGMGCIFCSIAIDTEPSWRVCDFAVAFLVIGQPTAGPAFQGASATRTGHENLIVSARLGMAGGKGEGAVDLTTLCWLVRAATTAPAILDR